MASSTTTALLQRLPERWRARVRELGAFGVVGGGSFVVDLAVFQLLYAGLGTGALLAKTGSTLVSMTVAYLGHRLWSFASRAQTGAARGYLVFAVINGLTLLLGLAVVAVVHYPLGQDGALVLQVANIGSIVLGTVVRWVAYRRWVFPATT